MPFERGVSGMMIKKAKGTSIRMNFTSGEIPGVLGGMEYGGPILALNEKTLRYKIIDGGIETWSRMP